LQQKPFCPFQIVRHLDGMNEQNEFPPKPNYKWPWFVAAGVLLFIVLAVVFVGLKARQIKQEHDFNAPIPTGGK